MHLIVYPLHHASRQAIYHPMELFLWILIILGMNDSLSLHVVFINNYKAFLEQAFCIKTVTLEVIQPSTGPVCPGQEIILTCTVIDNLNNYLTWTSKVQDSIAATTYYSGNLQAGPRTLGDFITTSMLMSQHGPHSNSLQCYTKICSNFKQQHYTIMSQSSASY